MALDVFHQVLMRLNEAAGGNPRQMVPILDVLRREKLFGSADVILNKFHSEGWIADAAKQDHVTITTWGIEELRRVEGAGSAARGSTAAEPKNAAALREAAAKATGLATLLAGFARGEGGTGAQRKAKAKKALAALSEAVEEALS